MQPLAKETAIESYRPALFRSQAGPVPLSQYATVIWREIVCVVWNGV